MATTLVMFFVFASLLASQEIIAQKKIMDMKTAFEQLDAAEQEAFTARVESSTAITDLDIAAAHVGSPRAVSAEDEPSDPSTCPTPVFDDNYNLATTVNGLTVSPQETNEIGDDFSLSGPGATIIHSFKTAWLLFACEHIFEATEFRWDIYDKVNFADGQPTGTPLDSHSYTFEEVELSFLGYVDLGWGCGFPLWQVEMVLDPPLNYTAGDYVVAFGDVNPVYPQFLAQLLPTYQSSSLMAISTTWRQFPWSSSYPGNLENAFLVVGQDSGCTPLSYVPNPGPTSCPTGPVECITSTPTAQPTFQPTWAPVINVAITCDPPSTDVECDLANYDITGTCMQINPAGPDIDVHSAISVTPGSCCGEQLIEIKHQCAEGGEAAQCTQSIRTVDTTQPAIDCPPINVVYPGDSWHPSNTGFATCNDNCDPNVTPTYTDILVECSRIERTWQCLDDCGNANSCIQVIGIICTDDPTFDPTIDPTNDPTSDPTSDPTNDPTNDPTSSDDDDDVADDDNSGDGNSGDGNSGDDANAYLSFNGLEQKENELNEWGNETEDIEIHFNKSVINVMVALCVFLVVNVILCFVCKR